MDSPELNEESQARFDWRERLMDAIFNQRFDLETSMEMFQSGLSKSHEEGIQDALHIVESILKEAELSEPQIVVLKVLEKSFKNLIILNSNKATLEQLYGRHK